MGIKIPILLIIVLGFIFFVYFFADVTRGGIEIWYEKSPWKHLILFVSMCLGIATNVLYDYLSDRLKAREAIEAGKMKTKMPLFMWEKIVLPFTISFLIFGFALEKFGNENMSLMLVTGSYQNGFFWQTIHDKMIKNRKKR